MDTYEWMWLDQTPDGLWWEHPDEYDRQEAQFGPKGTREEVIEWYTKLGWAAVPAENPNHVGTDKIRMRRLCQPDDPVIVVDRKPDSPPWDQG